MDKELQRVKFTKDMKQSAIRAAVKNRFLPRAKALQADFEQKMFDYARGLEENIKIKQVYDQIPEEYKSHFATSTKFNINKYTVIHKNANNEYTSSNGIDFDFKFSAGTDNFWLEDILSTKANGLWHCSYSFSLPYALPLVVNTLNIGEVSKNNSTKLDKTPKFLVDFIADREQLRKDINEYVDNLYHAIFKLQTLGKVYQYIPNLIRFIDIPEAKFYAPVPTEMYERINDLV